MAIIACGECGSEFSSQSPRCVHCGGRNPAYKRPLGVPERAVIVFALVFFAVVVLGMLGSLIGHPSKEKGIDSDAIELCEKNALRDPSNSASIYQDCDRMKAKFKEKWGKEP